MTPYRRAHGLTLIEVLVTSVLVALLLGLVSQFFVAQSRAANLQKAQNEANEATRTALGLIAWDLQNAGYRVSVSATNKAIAMTNSTHKDVVTTRFLNDDQATPVAQKVRYDLAQGVGETVTSLRRAQFADTLTTPPQDMQATIASMVGFNVRYETRADQFVAPTGTVSRTCPTGSTPVPAGAVGLLIQNCSVNWAWSDTPLRLVRQVKVQVLSRSETRVPRYTMNQTFTFEGAATSTLTADPGYVYHFAEQTVLVPNLGR